MDNTPITSVNSELISAGLNPSNPSQTYVDFANQLAQNSQQQALQEQAVARAKELTSQAQLQTRQGAEAAAAGVNPLLMDVMTPDQAEAYLRIILKEKGLEISDDDIQKWVDSLNGKPVNRQIVEAFANRFAKETTRSGQPAPFKTTDRIAIPEGSTAKDLGLEEDSADPMIGHVPEDGMYQVLYDNQGVIKKFIPGGKQAPDKSIALGEKDSQFWTNQWKTRIANKINPYLASARTQVGVAIQSYVRCVRALDTLEKAPVTKQDALNVIMEIGSVYKGGSPDQSAILQTSYQTLFGDFQDWMQSFLGKARTNLPENIRQHMVTRIQNLEDQSKKVVDDSISAAESLNSDVIAHFPDQWQKFLDAIDSQMKDANNPSKASPATSAKGGMTLPSVSDIDAELARRK